MPTSSTVDSPRPHTDRARKHKDGSVLLSIAEDRVCKLNGVGALTWMLLEENPTGLSIDDVVRELSEQFEAINAEGQLRYEVSREQLRHDTERFLRNITEMNLLQMEMDSSGQEFYYIKEGVSGTTSITVAASATRGNVTSRTTPAPSSSPAHPFRESPESEATQPIGIIPSVSVDGDIQPSKRDTFTAFIGLLAFDLLLKFRGFHSLIKKVEHWPTADPRKTDFDTCRRVRAMVDRAQMYYPKKAMCLQHSAVVTCLLRRRGVPAEIVLAAQEFPPKGHAWVEVNGEVVNDFRAVKDIHKVLRRF